MGHGAHQNWCRLLPAQELPSESSFLFLGGEYPYDDAHMCMDL